MNPVNYVSRCDSFTKVVNKLSSNEVNGCVTGVYIGTNETNRIGTFDSLKKSPVISDSCHVGFSSWFNFDVIIKRQSARAVLIDFNPNTTAFMIKTLDCVVSSKNRMEFADKIIRYISGNAPKFSLNFNEGYHECVGPQDEVWCELKIDQGWLSSDEGFNYIRKIALEGKIAVITEDVRSHEKFKRLANVIRENGFIVDTLYLSNISKYMPEKEDKESYVKTVNYLSGSETKIIHSLHDLEQEVIEVNKLELKSQDQRIGESLLMPRSYMEQLHLKYGDMTISQLQGLINKNSDSVIAKK